MTKKEQFILLRAEGRSYADIATALGKSKPTLLKWGAELQTEVENARTLRTSELFELYYVAKQKRVEAFGQQLQAILHELGTRQLTDVPTKDLLKLALDFGASLKAEAEPLKMQGEKRPMDFSLNELLPTTRDTWAV